MGQGRYRKFPSSQEVLLYRAGIHEYLSLHELKSFPLLLKMITYRNKRQK